jgi:hypothetical protein
MILYGYLNNSLFRRVATNSGTTADFVALNSFTNVKTEATPGKREHLQFQTRGFP